MPIRVIIAEDSAFQRKIISEMLSEHQDIEVVDVARNGKEAIEMVEKYSPDVLLLDLLMPELDGLTAFKYLLKNHPLPTIIFSVLDPLTMDKSIQALLLGAFDYVLKPGGVWKIEFPKFKNQLISKVLLAYKSIDKGKYKKLPTKANKTSQKQEIPIREVNQVKPKKPIMPKGIDVSKYLSLSINNLKFNIIVIGSSVGGPKTIKSILQNISKDFPSPILVVQHLDSHFMKKFAQSLNSLCDIDVKIAKHGEEIQGGMVYIAPGGKHTEITVRNNKPIIRTFNGDPINFCKPSIDPLFISAAHIFRSNTMGIILTGLGDDGVAGLGAIKSVGGKTIAESQETSVVYGMPKIAAERGVAQLVIPNYEVKSHMISFAKKFQRYVLTKTRNN
ncbi:MAG: chemotaxis-specific protein-glutamate methyltransferase CheB [Promethearchaeota archaeon]